MDLLNVIAILITLAAIFNYINYRYIGLPTTIGIMVIALLVSLVVVVAGVLNLSIFEEVELFVNSIDFNTSLMQGMLSFLLFASALHVNISDLMQQKAPILLLASVGVVASTFLVGIGAWYILALLGIELPFIYCLLFGALISPTDPIAVIGILKTAGAPKSLEAKISGESMFNDGVAVVVFIVLLGIASGGHDLKFGSVVYLFLEEAVGGLLFGLVIGYIGFLILRSIDNYQLEMMITLALVMGGYTLADSLHVSGPLAMVIAGLLIGNHGRRYAMSDKTREHVDNSWHLIDEVLNAVLFLLIGIEILAIEWNSAYLLAGLMLVPITLAARYFSVGILIGMMRRLRSFSPGAVNILTWGGLRGGISVALALSVPSGVARNEILTITYIIVVFSILVQGLSVGRVIRAYQQERQTGSQ
jgi:CPA1 family monovalent cation:H+ antiporter